MAQLTITRVGVFSVAKIQGAIAAELAPLSLVREVSARRKMIESKRES